MTTMKIELNEGVYYSVAVRGKVKDILLVENTLRIEYTDGRVLTLEDAAYLSSQGGADRYIESRYDLGSVVGGYIKEVYVLPSVTINNKHECQSIALIYANGKIAMIILHNKHSGTGWGIVPELTITYDEGEQDKPKITTANKHDRYARCEMPRLPNPMLWRGPSEPDINETAAWMDKHVVRAASKTVKWGPDAIKVSTAVNGDTKIKARIKSKKQLKTYIKVLKAVADEQFSGG